MSIGPLRNQTPDRNGRTSSIQSTRAPCTRFDYTPDHHQVVSFHSSMQLHSQVSSNTCLIPHTYRLQEKLSHFVLPFPARPGTRTNDTTKKHRKRSSARGTFGILAPVHPSSRTTLIHSNTITLISNQHFLSRTGIYVTCVLVR